MKLKAWGLVGLSKTMKIEGIMKKYPKKIDFPDFTPIYVTWGTHIFLQNRKLLNLSDFISVFVSARIAFLGDFPIYNSRENGW